MEFSLLPISQESLEWQCSILKLNGVTVLLNCGWSESLDPKRLAPLVPHLGELDLIVITHSDLKHIGALPYLLTKYSITCPVICTEPVCRLGELTCVGCLEDREKYKAPIEDYEVDDVLRVFMSRVTPLNFRETFTVQARGRILAACAFPAGGRLGSAFWTLHCGSLSAVYIVDFDMRSNRYVDGMELNNILPACRGGSHRWDVVITCPAPTAAGPSLAQLGAFQAPQEVAGASKAVTVAKNVREQVLLEDTIATLRRGGSVLLPVDVAGSVPELLLLFESAWAQDRQLATNYPLVWLSSMGDMILDQVKTRLEYMSRQVLGNFETRFGQNPFVFKNVKLFQTLEDLVDAHPLTRPKVILTTSPHLEGGDARELLFRLGSDPRTLLWVLGLPPRGTLARQLLDDFVVSQAVRKEYHLQQYLKHPLQEDLLRQHYEAKLQELSDTGSFRPEWQLPKAEPVEPKVEEKEEKEVAKAEPDSKVPMSASGGVPTALAPGGGVESGANAATAGGVGGGTMPSSNRGAVPVKSEFGIARQITAKLQAKEVAGGSAALWTPQGWSLSRTLAHSERRAEGDEYGHLLTASELAAWRAEDQEGNKYSFASKGTVSGVGAAAGLGADEVYSGSPSVKEEEELAVGQGSGDALADVRDHLRVHFREPMRCEIKDRTVRMACRVRHLPDCTLEPKDLCHMLQQIAPKHVVLLPTEDEASSTRSVVMAHFKGNRSRDKGGVLQVHAIKAKDPVLQIPLRSLKRKINFAPDAWTKLSFFRTSEGVRVSRVCAAPPPSGAPMQRVLELSSAPAIAGGNGKGMCEDASACSTSVPLQRNGTLFVSIGKDPLTLSSFKEHLSHAEWENDSADVSFRGLSGQLGDPANGMAPWSSRALVANNRAVLGWSKKEASDGGASQEGVVGPRSGPPTLRLEGVPGEDFFMARAALYKRCALL